MDTSIAKELSRMSLHGKGIEKLVSTKIQMKLLMIWIKVSMEINR